MTLFLGRLVHDIKIPNQPIWLGYKVLALCDAGYIYHSKLTSQVEGFSTAVLQVKPYPLSPISSPVLQILIIFPYCTYFFTIYMNNYFSNVQLFAQLLDYKISLCGTVPCSNKDFSSS